MRIRKYRAYYKGKMLYNVERLGNALYCDDGKNFDIFAFQRSNPAVLMDFVGITDKNGIEIYEDDILTNYHSDIQVVKYVGCQWQAKLIKRGTSFWPAQYLHCEYMDWVVIGNIHQNQELLKEATT